VRGGGGRGGVVIVDVASNVSLIMASAGGAAEGVKGNVWVHRWWLVATGKRQRWREAAEGDWSSPIKVNGCQRLLAVAADDKLWYCQGGR
jgi:hypothetical protein